MAVKTGTQLKADFQGEDPQDWATDVAQSALLTNAKVLSFTGKNGAGACTCTGAAVGDRVIGVAGITAGGIGGAAASFESTITVVNQIQQSSASNLSTLSYVVILAPAVA